MQDNPKKKKTQEQTSESYGVAKNLYKSLTEFGYTPDELGVKDEAEFVDKLGSPDNRKKVYDAVSQAGEFDIGDYESYERQLSDDYKKAFEKKREQFQERQNIANAADELHNAGNRIVKSGYSFNPEATSPSDAHSTYGQLGFTAQRGRNKEVAEAVPQYDNSQLSIVQLKMQRDRLINKLNEREAAVREQYNKDREEKSPFVRWVESLNRAEQHGSFFPEDVLGHDKEANAYRAAISELNDVIKTAEDTQGNTSPGFLKGVWDGLSDGMKSFLTMSYEDINKGITAYDIASKNNGVAESDAEQEFVNAMATRSSFDNLYGQNYSSFYKYGNMTGAMFPFMLELGLSPGSLFSAGSKGAAKIVGKQTIKEIGEQGVRKYIKANGVKGAGNVLVKNLGIVADDIGKAAITNATLGAGGVAADALGRMTGGVTQTEDGKFKIEKGKDIDEAVWQAGMSNLIEVYSEMLGGHFVGIERVIGDKLSKVFSPKWLTSVLSTGKMQSVKNLYGGVGKVFEQMGISDYFGEVGEEYAGQLLRTAFNLDDAYTEDADGKRVNLLFTEDFNKDILVGMALSMGVMGAAKGGLTAAGYAKYNHDVNKADARCGEVFGQQEWQGIKNTIDNTTNEDMGALFNAIANDDTMNEREKMAAADYISKSMTLRGFNLSVARTGEEQSSELAKLNTSFSRGYNSTDAQEMTDANNMLDYQRQRMIDVVGTDEDALDAVDWLNEAKNAPKGSERRQVILDYLNAKYVRDGMMQRVRDDIDMRIEESNAMVDAHTNSTTGMIHGATMKVDDRRVYVVGGKVLPYLDGTGIDASNSDESIIVRDAATGELEQVSPDAILSIDEALDPVAEKQTAANFIRIQYAQEAADKFNGVVTFNPGDTYTITTANGNQIDVQIVANENGVIYNGDGTVNVSDGETVFPIAKEIIQQQVDEANIARVSQFEQERAAENNQAKAAENANKPQYAINDKVTLRDADGNVIHGEIVDYNEADDNFVVDVDFPIGGKYVPLLTRNELESMVVEHNGTEVNPINTEAQNTIQEIITETNENESDATETSTEQQLTAFERIPKDEQGNPIYEQTDSDTAWDALLEQTDGDEDMAQTVAEQMVADKEAALKKVEKAKSKGGATIAEKIAAEKERKADIDAAKQELAIWQKIAGTANRRRMDAEAERRRIADEAAALRKAEEERLRAEREEAERIEREALNGVPDMVDDTPQDARARGYRRVNGHKIDRQEPLQAVQGKEVDVRFSNDVISNGRVAVIDAEQLQPSHIQGVRNPMNFIDEAQPKERNDEASIVSAQRIAKNIRPEEITSSVTAYTGAPTINARGETIQGNNRSDALRLMWSQNKDQAEKYKQYLIDHAQEFGLNAEDIAAMERPVLVNMIDVSDEDAIALGQYVAQDTESGGTERIKPKNAVQKMGADMRTFANLLLNSNDEEISFAGLIDKNGVDVLNWMSQKGYITPTQYKSAFDSKGNLTAEAKNDLRDIMYQSIFQGGSTRLEEMFNTMPAKAQKAILATAFRDYDSPNADSMIVEIQNSIRAYYALSQSADFMNAKTYKDVRLAVEGWKKQYQIDDATGQSYLPAENFSNFALLLAAMYKGQSQSVIQGTFNKLYDLIQGTQEANLFETPDNTPRTLAQAIKEVLNIDYNGQQRSNVLVGDTATNQRGQQGSTGDAATGERTEDGERTADSAGSIEGEDRRSENKGHLAERQGDLGTSVETSDNEFDEDGLPFVISSTGTTIFGEIKEETGLTPAPIKLSLGNSKYGLIHLKKRHEKQIRNAGFNSVEEFVEYVCKNYKRIRQGENSVGEENGTYLLQIEDNHSNTLYVELSTDGSYWGVNSGGVFRKEYGNNKKEVWSASEVQNEQSATDSTLRDEDKSDNPTTPNGNVPPTSDSKDTTISPTTNELGEKSAAPSVQEQIQAAEAEVNTNPTEAQKEAGNYKKGHVQIGTFNVTIEQPKGSIRRGVDADGKKWETEMHNTYGYIRGTEGVDGDHIDVFLSDDIDGWDGHKVFVVDQRNADGSFDEHKVMLGFNDINDAEAAYMSNYEDGWQGLGAITGVSIEEFEKWITSSHRKTKAFAEYKSVKTTEGQNASAERRNLADFKEGDVVRDYYDKKLYRIKKHSKNGVSTIAMLDEVGNEVGTTQMNAHNNSRYSLAEAPVKAETPTISQESEQVSDQDDAPYTIAPAQYTTKKGKVLDMHLVKLQFEMRDSVKRHASSYAKYLKGWWDAKQGGFMMRSKEDAEKLSEYVVDAQEQEPVSLNDIQALNDGDVVFTEPKQPKEQPKDKEYHPIWQYSIHVDADGYTTISRDDVSGVIPIGDARFRYSTNSPEEMLDILRNPLNGMQEALEAVGVTLENKIAIRKIKEEREQKRAELRLNGVNGYKIGDKVIYTPASGKAIKATIYDFEDFGDNKPVLDIGLSPVMYEVAEWENVEPMKPIKEYHGGDRVFSLKHNANKDIYMAHHVGGKVEYEFTDGTKANADEVQDALPIEQGKTQQEKTSTSEVSTEEYVLQEVDNIAKDLANDEVIKNTILINNETVVRDFLRDEIEKYIAKNYTDYNDVNVIEIIKLMFGSNDLSKAENAKNRQNFVGSIISRVLELVNSKKYVVADASFIDNPKSWVGRRLSWGNTVYEVDYIKGDSVHVTRYNKNNSPISNIYSIDAIQGYLREGTISLEDNGNTSKKNNKRGVAKSKLVNDKETKRFETLQNGRLQEKNATEPKNEGQFGLVSDERMNELKERLRKKLGGQMNIGIDPEILAIGLEIAVGHIDRGVKTFTDFAKVMISDLGDVIRPYLKAFYNGARELPEVVENGLASDMTPYDEVQSFDVANFDKQGVDAFATAETITREAEVEQEVEVAQERIKKKRQSNKETKGKAVNLQQQTRGLFDDIFAETNKADTELHRKFAMTVKADMLAALDNDTKPYRSILDLRKRARELGIEVDNDGRTDILLQELVEDGLVRAAREVVARNGRNSRASYDLICKLYEMQPTIAARSSNRIKMQQYSTPLPMAWIANRFAMEGKADGKVLEPTAGNGMLVFTVPVEQVHANELDETRLDNLREQGFAEVTQQDATEPFEGGMQYDVVIANPPFGKREAVEYDGKMIPGLDPQITLNSLASMKDNGRAAIIIGGNMEYASNGSIKSMKPFFTYLYDHYNVKGIIDMSGGLYAKQGTTFPTRMILIEGRRSDEERAQTAVYPPVESKAIRKAESFDDLYDIINEVLNSNEKTNGTEVLRSRERGHVPISDNASGNSDGAGHNRQSRKNDEVGSRTTGRGRTELERTSQSSKRPILGERGQNDTVSETGRQSDTIGQSANDGRGLGQRAVGNGTQSVDGVEIQRSGIGLKEETKKRNLSEEKLPYRPHNTAFRLESVAPAAMVEAMDNVLTQIEAQHGSIDEYIRTELGYDTVEEAHQALAAEQMDSVAMAIYQMKQGQALIIGDQTGVGKGRQMAALIRWAVKQGKKPIFITQKADLFSDIYRDLVDVGSGDLVPFIFNSPSAKENKGEMVDANGNVVHRGLSDAAMKKVMASGTLPDEYDFAVLTYSQVNTGDAISQQEMEEAAKKSGARTKKSKNVKNGKATPKATFLRAIAEDNYLLLDESHTAAGSSNTGAYLQSIIRTAKAATFASATFAKRPDTMPLYAIRTAMSKAKVEPDKMISIIEKGGVTLQEIMSRELTNAGQMVRRERDMSDVITDWKTITDPETVRRARENYDRTIAAFNAIIKFQEEYVKPMIEALDTDLAIMAESAGIKRGTDKMGVENVPFASKTYNYTKQLMLALKVDAIVDEVEAEINAGRHPVIALESTMESSIKDYAAGEIIDEPTFSASLLKGLYTVMQYTITDENGNKINKRYSPQELGPAGEKAYYELQDFIRESTSDIFISPLDAIIERLHEKGYKVGELTGRNMYVERDEDGSVVVKRRTDKDKKRMQREFNSGILDVLILNKSASTGISLHASEKFSDQRQRSMIIAQPLSDINDYMQMIGRIDRTGQVHRGYYINLGLPVPAENRFLMMLSTKLKSLNANTTTSQDSESNDVEAPDLLNKYGSQVVVEYLRDNVEIYEKMGTPLKKVGSGGNVQASELDEYKPQEDDARKITGYVALLTTKEQEEFYDDVVRRYNELIKYLNDTGSNDLKISVMPLRAKTIDRRVSSEGIDPNGSNPFARNSYVEKVEMDVLRKPMKADEIRKVIEQINKGIAPAEYLESVINTIRKEDEARVAAEEERYEKAKAKAAEDITKQTNKINRQQKRSEEEKRVAIENFIEETNKKVEEKHNNNILRINQNNYQIMHYLRMFEVGKSYLVPDNLNSMIFDFATPAIFCGYKTKDSKITASTTLAVFATLDGRRRIEIKLSQIDELRSIDKMTNDNWDAARSTTLDNWDSQIPNEKRKIGFIMTGNILQAIADTQDEYGGYPGQLISYTDIDGNVHDGILMPDKWDASMLKTSGAPLSSRLQQIKDYKSIISHDGKVEITGSSWAKMFYLTVPKTKKDGAVYYENKTLLNAAGGNFYPYRGKLRADIPADRIDEVVQELTKLGVKVNEERNDDDTLYRSDDTLYRIRKDAPPIKTGIGYKVFVLKNGELYPPMVANPNGEATPVGVWLDADAAPIAGQSKTGRSQVKAGGKGTQGGSGKLAYRPGWHLGKIPYALQFNRNDENGERTLFPANFVWAEVEYANDVDYQDEAMSYGYNQNGKFQHSYAGLPRVPINGAYTYRTNPNPETDPWIITGAMRVKRLLTPTEVDEMVKAAGREPQRRQDGAITDEQIVVLNAEIENDFRDGVGSSTNDELAQSERQRMAERVNELAKKLHLDNVEVVTDASTLEGNKKRAKGFYSKSTGKITIVIPNHSSVFDAEQTLLHEAVAHYGLRQLFGKHFDTFLDNVFNNADNGIRKRIVALAAKNGWDFRKATEEYLATIAENTEFEAAQRAGWWQKIKDLFLNMLHRIGFEDFGRVTLTDNELRYILWRSYENLAKGGNNRSVFGEAEDVAKQYELKVGNFAEDNLTNTIAENDDALYRNGDPEMHERALARERYEQRVKSGMYQSQEALQDSMLSVKEAMMAVLGKDKYIEDVDGFENAYLGENRLSSVNKAEADAFAYTLFKPMLDEVAKLAKNEAEREELTNYMMAKHGLERNAYMRQEALNNGDINASNRDFAGLTALTEIDNVADAEAEAERMVAEYENEHDTAELWEKVNAVSKAILQKSYECGMMSKEAFDKVSSMYDFYIPLRGFDEKTSAEAYAYLSHKNSAFNAPIKKAEGRRSKADDPFANLQSMAESAIMQGNRNKLVKQRFLNFALNHPSDLVSVSDIWVEYDAVTDEWKPVFPDNIESTDTPEEVEKKMRDFETNMESLAQQYPDKYKNGKDTIGIPYRVVENRDMQQHQVIVKRGGRDYVITINGNPRAAQALNGQTNPDNDMSGAIGAILRAGEKINRQLSAVYTTRNPDFIVSNFMRDMLYTNTMAWVKESPNYALRFHRNYLMVNPVTMKLLLAKYRKGTLDMSNKTEAMFHQFMMNGGETGYANIRDIEQHKNDIKRELKRANGKLEIGRAINLLGERLDEMNRAVENCARFAAFITSREMGRSIDRAIYDAKEISVNFNKKGSGAKFYDSVGQTKVGNASALISGLGRSGYVFWNAAIQGTTNFGRQMKRHPAKAFIGVAAMFLLGAIVAYLGGDDDEDDKNAYYNLPEWVRRSNILFRAGDSWISIPLPIEYRAFYGMGELMTSVLSGKEHMTGGEIAEAILGQATQILPLDFLEGGGGWNAFVPSVVKPAIEAYIIEKSWTGMPLYKDTPFNKDMPEWTKAYKSANKHIVNLAAVLNEATGGDKYTKGAIDINPAKIEYMLNGYFGGVFSTIDKMSKTAEIITGDREYDPRSILLVNRLVKAGDERTEYRAVNNEYFRLKEEHDRLKTRLRHYEEDTDNGIFDFAEKIDFLYNSPEYERYEIFEEYSSDIDILNEELKEAVDDDERKDIEAKLNELKKEMIEKMNTTRKRK